MKSSIYVQDIECDACDVVITKTLKRLDGVRDIAVKTDHVVVDFDESKVKEQELIDAIKAKGYRASKQPYSRMGYAARWRDFLRNKQTYRVEWQMLRYIGIALAALLVVEALAWLALYGADPQMLSRYGIWIFYLDLSTTLISAGIWQLKAHRATMTPMAGMMVGMGVGMQSGFLIGAIVGATNGMFIGSMAGMLISCALGLYAAKDAGIMAAMQGLMSGLMGGLMGAMTTVMMLVDNIHIFMPFFMLINVLILLAMSYMIYEDIAEGKETRPKPADLWTFLSYVFVFTIVIAALMIHGPHALIVQLN